MNEPLSYFVKYKEAVDNVTMDQAFDTMLRELSSAIGIVGEHSESGVEMLNAQYSKILNECNQFTHVLNKFKTKIDAELRLKETSYLSTSYRLYQESRNDTAEYILERSTQHPLISNTSIKKILIHTISENCSWKYPGMVIRPSNNELIEPMMSLDPLYIMDEHLLLLDEIKSKWNPTYQARIRYNIINDDSEVIFKTVPTNQLGFVLVTDFFNYKPIAVIQKYINEIYNLLRPGGVLLFTYNNCNLPIAVRNFEKMLYTYTPGSLIEPMMELTGFDIVSSFDDRNTNTNWIEVKKPGKISSLRGGQCLGKIVV